VGAFDFHVLSGDALFDFQFDIEGGAATVVAAGIASTTAFGGATVAANAAASVLPTGIASGTVFGTQTVAANLAASVLPSGIPSTSAFGTPLLSAGFIAALAPVGISSAEQFGSTAFAGAFPPGSAYATVAQFVLTLGAREAAALADPEATGSPVAGRLEYALELASADIDAILGDRVSSVAAGRRSFLQAACIHIARWHLSGANTIENDPITAKHDYYTTLLRDMADGVIGNSGSGSGTAAAPHYGDVQIVAPANVNPFSRANRR
jgi:phage gp36-like protein